MPNPILQRIGPPVSFSAGGDVSFSPASTTFGNGHKSAQWDRGDSPQSDEYGWRVKTKFATTPANGETLDIYMASSDGVIVDGTISPADAGFSDANALANLVYVGSVVLDGSTNSMQSSGVFRMTARYGVLVWWNATAGDALSVTAGDHEFIATPVYPEAQ